MTVYDYVKILANEKKLDIKAVETACGFSNGAISKWTDSIPKADKLLILARFFNVPIEYFLTGYRGTTNEFLLNNNPYNLTLEEKTEVEELISNYRDCDNAGKHKIIEASRIEADRFRQLRKNS